MLLKGKVFFTVLLALLVFQTARAQYGPFEVSGSSSEKLNRSRGLDMLKNIKQLIETRYYDKKYRGINLEERFETAAAKIKTLSTNTDIFRVIAQVLLEFDDSHTRFYPPGRSNQVEYGFSLQMIGGDCLVVDVKKGSDAELKGIKTGDVVTRVGQYAPTRENLWKLNYILYALSPQEKLKIRLLGSGGAERELEIAASFKSVEERKKEAEKRTKEKKENPYKCQKISEAVIACKLETFSIEKKYIDKMMAEVRPYQKFILDLRGNGGGYVSIEEYLTGHFFDRDVKIADFITRSKTEERIAKSQKGKLFGGELAVLIDSNSASASEVFARVVQLEKRGKVFGDVSAGAVMTSNSITMANSRGPWNAQTLSFYGLNLTVADLIMSDGNRLEKIGVVPDYPVGPTGQALLEKSDPVLAFAAELFGAKITDAEAGKYNFLYKKPENEAAESEEEKEN